MNTPMKDFANDTTATFSTPPTQINKENEARTPQQASLNLSGTLLTSYQPVRSSPRARKTPSRFESTVSSLAFESPTKNVLSESQANLMHFETPRKSMHLVDLLSSSAHNATSTPIAPPLSSTKKPRIDNTGLLKSALKNSTMKMKDVPTPLTFASVVAASSPQNTKDQNVSLCTTVSEYSSIIDVSSDGESKAAVTPRKVEFSDDLQKTQEHGLDEEVKDLIDEISIVLEENEPSEKSKEELEHEREEEIGGCIQKIVEQNPKSVEQPVRADDEEHMDEIFQVVS